MCSRAHRYIQKAVSFLTTRVKHPNEYDWGKLKKVLKYLNGTRHMKLKMMVENMSLIRWWVDASYNVHWDIRGHNGAMMSLGKGDIISNSNKQNLNVNISTEGELVSTYDQMPYILNALYFIKTQGYTIEKNTYQENKYTIRL